jgi:hypothetical protein
MNNAELRFPIFDDSLMPPPRLTVEQYVARVSQWMQALTPTQREALLARDEVERITVPFRLTDADPATDEKG